MTRRPTTPSTVRETPKFIPPWQQALYDGMIGIFSLSILATAVVALGLAGAYILRWLDLGWYDVTSPQALGLGVGIAVAPGIAITMIRMAAPGLIPRARA